MIFHFCLRALLGVAVLAFPTALFAAEVNSEAMRRARTAAENNDFPAAIEILKQEAAKGSAEAANALGELHFAGKGVKASPSEAARWFQQAVDASYPPAMLNLGTILLKGAEGLPADPDKGQFLIRTAAEEGFAPAQVALGRAVEAEPEKTRDLAEARFWYEKAAAQENADGLLALARFFHEGIAGARDPVQAFETYRRAARAGSAFAMNEVGVRYQKGLGVTADPTAAIGWFTLATQHGLPAAFVNLGNCYEMAKGVLQDFDKAGSYYAAAAKKKFGPAQFLLAQLFEQGKGTKPNPVYAYVNYYLAAANSVEAAAKKRDELKAKLTPEQLQEATTLLASGGTEPSAKK
jgi:TPR repeat protein